MHQMEDEDEVLEFYFSDDNGHKIKILMEQCTPETKWLDILKVYYLC